MHEKALPRRAALAALTTLVLTFGCGDDDSGSGGTGDGSSDDGQTTSGTGGDGGTSDDGASSDGGSGSGTGGTSDGGSTGTETGGTSGTGTTGGGSTSETGATTGATTSGATTTGGTTTGATTTGATTTGATTTGATTTGATTTGATTTGATTTGGTTTPSLACADTCGGCCYGESCLDGDMNSACGIGGATCQPCEDFEECVTHACALNSDYDWNLTVVSATVNGTWDNGGPGSCYSDIVDAYVTVDLNGNAGTSDVVEETTTPVWNDLLITDSAGAFTGNVLTINLYDDDGAGQCSGPDPIDNCAHQVNVAELLAGGFTIDFCGTLVLDLVFALDPT